MKWEPLEGIPQTLCLYDLKYDCNELTISLQNKDQNSPILAINFEWFFALRIMYEGNFLKDSYDMDETVTKMQLEPSSWQKWTLFIVENSHYLEWFHEQSVDINRDLKIVHYVIKTPDDVTEVLYSEKTGNPVVRWI